MPKVPDRRWFDPVLNAYLHTGDKASIAAIDMTGLRPRTVAIDIETPGLDRAFEINCMTAAWIEGEEVQTVLLDPVRNHADKYAARALLDHAATLVLHNAPFDIPALMHHGLVAPTHINRVVDTLVLARMAWPDPYDSETGKRDLTSLSVRLLGMSEFAQGMQRAFKAAGYRTIQAGYENMDIDSPIYRQGAMADTVATLRLEPLIRAECRRRLTDHPFVHFGATNTAEADEVIAVTETVARVMLRRTAFGLNVDAEYLDKYRESVDNERMIAEAELAHHGLAGGSGKGAKLIEYLDSIGELPVGWPKTKTGKLSATKGLLDSLDHPLVTAQRRLAETDKVLVYLSKVARQSAITGRCHPQVSVLGASQTGRMSYSSPELQQFPKDARAIICHDGQGLTSIDWSQIEPVTMGLMAKDEKFLADYEAGEDLYGPVQESCGIDRTLAKVVLLATMYGQGVSGLSKRIGKTEDESAAIRRQMMAAMPNSAKWMTRVAAIAENYGMIPTAAGRVLPVDKNGVFRAVNYVVQGSAYDVLAHTICEMERQGIGDYIYLAMHDEVVVGTEVADDVRRIMETPPPFLERWAGRTPVLRTDRADMGERWAKV
jgi:DNA polymerase-1